MYRMPEVFKTPLADGYGYAPQRPFRRSSMDSGLARTRPASKTVVTKFNVTWFIARELMATFRYIVFNEIKWQEFETKLILDGEVKYMKAQFINAEQPFTVENVQNVVYKITAELECRDLDLMDEYAMLNTDENNILDGLTNPLHQLVNVEMPIWNWDAS